MAGVLFFLFRLGLKFHIDKKLHILDIRFRWLSLDIIFFMLSILSIGMVETNLASFGSGWLIGVVFAIPLAVSRFKPSTITPFKNILVKGG